jgi:predicted ester cyclase
VDLQGRRWTVQDQFGNLVYLTEERWQHIIDAENHPEVEDYEEYVQATVRHGQRRQEPLNPRKYRYVRMFADLPDGMNHVVVIVMFGSQVDSAGRIQANNYVATAFLKHILAKE